MSNASELEDSLVSYRSQISQLTSILESCVDEQQKVELKALLSDFEELTQVVQEAQLNLRKSELLSQLDESIEFKSEEIIVEQQAENAEEQVLLDGLVGQKCSIPHWTPCGRFYRANAVICGLELDTLSVRVMLCQAIRSEERPCDHFLTNNCHYASSNSCRYSHGFLVSWDSVSEYQDPQYSLLEQGGICLAKLDESSESLWSIAEVMHVDYEFQECIVDAAKVQYTIPLERVFPLPENSDTLSEDEASTNDAVNGVDEDLDTPSVLCPTVSALGEWECHTRGVASRMMAAMGYEAGQGLGSRGQGRADPVPIIRLPPGRSLDYVMQLKERSGNKAMFNMLRRKRCDKDEKNVHNRISTDFCSNSLKTKTFGNRQNVFSFLNKRLAGCNDGHNYLKNVLPTDCIQTGSNGAPLSARRAERKALEGCSDAHLQRDLFAIQEDVLRAESRVRAAKSSLLRNEGRDKAIAEMARRKLRESEAELQQLQQRMTKLDQQAGERRSKKKLTIF